MLFKCDWFSPRMDIFHENGPSFGCEVAWQTAEGIGATAVESFLVFITHIL